MLLKVYCKEIEQLNILLEYFHIQSTKNDIEKVYYSIQVLEDALKLVKINYKGYKKINNIKCMGNFLKIIIEENKNFNSYITVKDIFYGDINQALYDAEKNNTLYELHTSVELCYKFNLINEITYNLFIEKIQEVA